MKGSLRFLQLLTMSVWVGGLAFFAFVLAPTAFHLLPVHDAGAVVGASLKLFDKIELFCGAFFLLATALLYQAATHRIRGRYEAEFLLALVMVLATGYLEWNIIPAMDQDQRQAGGDVNAVEPTNPAKLHFDKLHARSEKVAGTALFLGLGVLFLMSREHARLAPSATEPEST